MSEARISVRSAKAEECNELGLIGFEAWLGSDIARAYAGRTDQEALLGEFKAFCAEHHDSIFVALVDARLVGWGARASGDNYISDLWVLPAMQGRGVGMALIAQMEADIRKTGYSSVELEAL